MDCGLMEKFKCMDINKKKNGLLTMEEMKSEFEKLDLPWTQVHEDRFINMDQNGDGRVSFIGKSLNNSRCTTKIR